MEIFKSGDEPCTLPDDAFHMYGKPLSSWLREVPNASEISLSEWFQWKEDLADRAVETLVQNLGWKDINRHNCAKALRFEPYVVEHYEILKKEGSVCPLVHYFVFKEDNNGNTYVVFEKTSIPLYQPR